MCRVLIFSFDKVFAKNMIIIHYELDNSEQKCCK